MKSFTTILLLLFFQHCFGQEIQENLEDLDSNIIQLIEDYKAVGLALAVVKEGGVLYSKGFGYRDLENNLAVTSETVFPIGSTSKAFTGTLLGILESQEKLSLKDKPGKYIPRLEFYNDKMNNLITIEDLLSHKSGLGNQGTTEVFFPDDDKLEIASRIKYLKPEGEIKNSFEYSNIGYTLAGTVVEQVSGKSWSTNIKERIFQELDMQNSFTDYDLMKKSSNYSLPYGLYQGAVEPLEFEDFHSIAPAGAIKSTVTDLSNWMLAWLNEGLYGDKQVIPKAYVKKATTLQNIKNANYEKEAFLFGDGFGWRLRSSYGHFRIDHGGNTFGFSSSLVMFPFERIGIVVLSNQDNSFLPHIVSDLIARRLLGIDPVDDYPINVQDIYKPKDYVGFNNEKRAIYDINEYCGNYTAKGFGTIKVVREENKLLAQFPSLTFQLEHEHYNTFFLKPFKDFKDAYNPQFDMKFESDQFGKIKVLKLYSQKEPINFYRE